MGYIPIKRIQLQSVDVSQQKGWIYVRMMWCGKGRDKDE